jgi:hypothetical protein
MAITAPIFIFYRAPLTLRAGLRREEGIFSLLTQPLSLSARCAPRERAGLVALKRSLPPLRGSGVEELQSIGANWRLWLCRHGKTSESMAELLPSCSVRRGKHDSCSRASPNRMKPQCRPTKMLPVLHSLFDTTQAQNPQFSCMY